MNSGPKMSILQGLLNIMKSMFYVVQWTHFEVGCTMGFYLDFVKKHLSKWFLEYSFYYIQYLIKGSKLPEIKLFT